MTTNISDILFDIANNSVNYYYNPTADNGDINNGDDEAESLLTNNAVTSLQEAPALSTIAGYSNLDNFLLGQDAFIIGGPIVNNGGYLFQPTQNQISSLAQPALTNIGISTLNFTTGNSLDGHLFGSQAPQLTINSTTYSRTNNNNTTITDYAVIAVVQSAATNNLIYVAGIRNLGTMLASLIMWYVSGAYPYFFSDTSTFTAWQNALSSNSIVVVEFTIPYAQNNLPITSPGNPNWYDLCTNGVGTFPITTNLFHPV
jgi:hypothetical protein